MSTGTIAVPSGKKAKFNLSRLFIKEEGEPIGAIATPVVLATPQVVSQVTTDPRVRESLEAALAAGALGSYDYYKFKKSLDSLKSLIPDEATRFKSAFVTAGSMGITKVSLTETAQHYVSLLDQEKAQFKQFLDEQTGTNVTGREKSLKDTDVAIQQKSDQIKALTDEISQLQKQKLDISNELASARGRLETTSNTFAVVQSGMVQEIRDDVQKINTYL